MEAHQHLFFYFHKLNKSYLVLAFPLSSRCLLYPSPQSANLQNFPSCCSGLPGYPQSYSLAHPLWEASVGGGRQDPCLSFSESSNAPQFQVSRGGCLSSSDPGSRSGSPSRVTKYVRRVLTHKKSHPRMCHSGLFKMECMLQQDLLTPPAPAPY